MLIRAMGQNTTQGNGNPFQVISVKACLGVVILVFLYTYSAFADEPKEYERYQDIVFIRENVEKLTYLNSGIYSCGFKHECLDKLMAEVYRETPWDVLVIGLLNRVQKMETDLLGELIGRYEASPGKFKGLISEENIDVMKEKYSTMKSKEPID